MLRTSLALIAIALQSNPRLLCNAAVTADDIDALRIEVLNKIDTTGNTLDGPEHKPLIGSILRLIFHDCAGPLNTGSTTATLDNTIRLCDGCIDVDLDDHNGIEELAMLPIEDICTAFSDRMNRADCWSAVATITLEYSAALSSEAGTLPDIPYYFGRIQCPTSPDAVTDLETRGTEFPLAHQGWDAMFEFFETFFGFSKDEAAVLIGAHTVGRAHPTASGFDGIWSEDSFGFNNHFFVNLLDKNQQWDQVHVPDVEFPQWVNEGRDADMLELMMLNSDMAVIAAMEDHGDIDESTGIVGCRWEGFDLVSGHTTCPREETFDISLIYAKDNQRFLDDFALAWEKLLTHNYNELTLTKVVAASFVDQRTDDAVDASQVTIIDLDDIAVGPAMTGGAGGDGVSSTTTTTTTTAAAAVDSNLCCIANRIPNWNGRCWGATTESECLAVRPPTARCHWDPNNCRASQQCKLRHELCSTNEECCSERCRPDTTPRECR